MFETNKLLLDYDLATAEAVASDVLGIENVRDLAISFNLDTVTGDTKSGTCSLQASIDGISWFDIATVSATDVATQTVGVSCLTACYKYARGYFDGNVAITGGTLNIDLAYRS